MSEFIKKVINVQKTLKAPKNQFNKFGGYNYRNCEDILEAVKPLLADNGLVLTISDEVLFSSNGENYVKATATLTDGSSSISNSAVAREQIEQKGMNSAQITGSSSSYARKYALNGLFLIDDTRDADATNTHGKEAQVEPKPQTQAVKPATTQSVTQAPKAVQSFKRNVSPQTTSSGDDL